MRFILAASAVIPLFLTSAPASATDYSDLLKPHIARLHLITAERAQQAQCAGLALYLGQVRQGFGHEIGTALAEKVPRRLAADLGDKDTAEWFVDGKVRNLSSPLYDSKLKADIVTKLEGHCRTLFDQAAKGDAQLEVALGPVPSKPLDLPGPGQCLAVLSYAAERDAQDAAEIKGLMQQVWIDEAPKTEQARRRATMMTAVSMLRSIAPDEHQLNGMFAACVPTMREVIGDANVQHPERKLR